MTEGERTTFAIWEWLDQKNSENWSHTARYIPLSPFHSDCPKFIPTFNRIFTCGAYVLAYCNSSAGRSLLYHQLTMEVTCQVTWYYNTLSSRGRRPSTLLTLVLWTLQRWPTHMRTTSSPLLPHPMMSTPASRCAKIIPVSLLPSPLSCFFLRIYFPSPLPDLIEFPTGLVFNLKCLSISSSSLSLSPLLPWSKFVLYLRWKGLQEWSRRKKVVDILKLGHRLTVSN